VQLHRIGFMIFLLAINNACAVLHHVQIGDIDNRNGEKLRSFEIMVSETGINLDEAAGAAKVFSNSKVDREIDKIRDIIGMFQMGPRTGNPVYNDRYAYGLIDEIRGRCPNGKITGLMSIREMRQYPVISGEIVKIKGYC
jgi:hypothetical protein